MTVQVSHNKNCHCTSYEDALALEIAEALRKIGYNEVRTLTITVDGRDVVIAGTLSSYYLRQQVEIAILNIPSLSTFRSQIEVRGVVSHA